jgi:hypothetical protein
MITAQELRSKTEEELVFEAAELLIAMKAKEASGEYDEEIIPLKDRLYLLDQEKKDLEERIQLAKGWELFPRSNTGGYLTSPLSLSNGYG